MHAICEYWTTTPTNIWKDIKKTQEIEEEILCWAIANKRENEESEKI